MAPASETGENNTDQSGKKTGEKAKASGRKGSVAATTSDVPIDFSFDDEDHHKEKGRADASKVPVAAPLPRTSYSSSEGESEDEAAERSKAKEKTFLIPTHLMEADTIRQEHLASQQDELRNTIIRAKDTTPTKPVTPVAPQIPREPAAIRKNSGEIFANVVPTHKVSPVPPPPQRKQLVTQPAVRTPQRALETKRPVKARGASSSGKDPRLKAVTKLQKSSSSDILQDTLNKSSVNVKTEGRSGRRVVTSSNALDLAGEKMVLVENPNWEEGAGKVRARIGGDDAEAEESKCSGPIQIEKLLRIF